MLANHLLTSLSGSEGKLYSDDVFVAYTRTGTGADAVITTGIDMTECYMLWSKGRSGTTDHAIYDSARGVTFDLVSNSTAAQTTQSTGLKAVSSTGHTVGSLAKMNSSGATYVDFVFKKKAKFCDVVTYTGDGVAGRQIPHALGIAPGMVIVKRTDTAENWAVYHRSLSASNRLQLNTTDATTVEAGPPYQTWNAEPTDSIFYVGSTNRNNGAGSTYVAYLFAHDTSAEGIIQCGSYSGTGAAGVATTLGWEPQFLLIKEASAGTSNWMMLDTMRGLTGGSGNDAVLKPNTSDAETAAQDEVEITATGFIRKTSDTAGDNLIYLAIRRPNKPPTSGTQVYNAIARTGTGAAATVTGVGFAPDLVMSRGRSASFQTVFHDRLRGATRYLQSAATSVENTLADGLIGFDVMDGAKFGVDSIGYTNQAFNYINWCLRRYPGVFDQVCDTATGSAHDVSHNLGTVPELMIRKKRAGTAAHWIVYHSALGNQGYIILNDTGGATAGNTTVWNSTTPTSLVFSLGTETLCNNGTDTYVTYLFATKPGISKCFSYTGDGGSVDSAGSSQTINCGFSTGSRFVMLKCTSHASDWVIVDTVRGLIAGNDPALSLNTTAAEVTTTDLLDPDASGFVVNQLASGTTSANFNVTGRTYIGLAFA